MGDTSESDTNFGVGTRFGGERKRLPLAFQEVDTDDPGVALGGYTVLDSDIVLSGFYAITTEKAGDSWESPLGLVGRSNKIGYSQVVSGCNGEVV